MITKEDIINFKYIKYWVAVTNILNYTTHLIFFYFNTNKETFCVKLGQNYEIELLIVSASQF